jgi:hypothetical protein
MRTAGRNVNRVAKVPTYVSEQSRDSSVGIVTDYGLDDQMIGVRYRVQTDSRVHPDFYPMGAGGSFSGGTAI